MGVEPSLVSKLGPYALGERLGVGGMAEVYVATRDGPHGFEKRVALKRILPQLARDVRFVAMFCDEARICAMLEHPNIVRVIDFGESAGQLFMAMEYVDGITVARLLRAVSARHAQIPLGAVLYIAHEILRGLSYAHQATDDQYRPLNIVHRDVSPGNVLIGREGEIKLTDFGIVRSAFIDRRTNPGELKGKIGYMSPEQVMGEELDPRSDLFTAAIIVAELALVRPLFPGRNELEILTRTHTADLTVLNRYGRRLPGALTVALRRALSPAPEDRFQTADEFLGAIRDVAQIEGIRLDASQLAPWLSSLGVLPDRTGSRQMAATRAPEYSAQRRPGSGAQPTYPAEMPSSMSGARRRMDARHKEEQARQLTSADDRDKYVVRLPDGPELLRADLVELLELGATGRLPFESVVARGEQPPIVVRELRGPHRLLGRPAYAFSDTTAAKWMLPLTRRELPGVLFRLANERATGVLRVVSGEFSVRIFVAMGELGFIASTEVQQLFGQRLLAEGKVTKKHLAHVLQHAAKSGQRLGEACVRAGLLTREEVKSALVAQRRERLIGTTTRSAATVSFVPGVTSGEELPIERSSRLSWVSSLCIEAYSSEDVGAFLAPFRDRRIDPGPVVVAPGELAVTDPMRRALHYAASSESLKDLIESLKSERVARPSETLMAVFIGLSSGILSVAGWPTLPTDLV